MKQNLLLGLVVAALAGCAAPSGRQAWDMKPMIDIRHGMGNAAALYQLGRHHQERGRTGDAQSAFESALAADPRNVDVLNALGALHAERGDLERAGEYYRRVVELGPQRAYLFNNIGYALHLQGRHAEAVAAFRQALALSPGYERAWINLERAAQAAKLPDVVAMAQRRNLDERDERLPVLAAAEAVQREAAPLPLSRAAAEVAWSDTGPPRVNSVAATDSPAGIPGGAGEQARLRSVSRGASSGRALRGVAPGQPPGSGVSLAAALPGTAVKASLQGAVAGAPVQARIEISNGNGINGCAAGVRSQLKGMGVAVARLTNFSSFSVRQTVIEYSPGYDEQAKALQARFDARIVLRPAKYSRAGSDIRLIVGYDWGKKARILSELVGVGQPSV